MILIYVNIPGKQVKRRSNAEVGGISSYEGIEACAKTLKGEIVGFKGSIPYVQRKMEAFFENFENLRDATSMM